jgi:preprotein translocase subunit SecF
LKASLTKSYPAKGKTPAGSIVSSKQGSTVSVSVPFKGAGGELQSLVTGYAGVPVTTVTAVKGTTCPTDCRYKVLTQLPIANSTSLQRQFTKEFAASPARPGVQPQYVQPVIGSTTCTGHCYYIRSSILNGAQQASFTSALKKAYPSSSTRVLTYTSVGGTVASSTKQNAFIAVAVAAIFILSYITFAFRHMPHPTRYGAAAIIAMLHDVLVVVGIFSILGKVLHVEVDSTFITALLTIIGFSVHDTIVIFDRIRENVSRRTGEGFEAIVNHSVLQSFVRSINTSFTVVLTLGAIFLFSGESIRYFVLAMLIGIISGTYSSIFNASPVLVVWQTGEWRKLFGRDPNPTEGSLPGPAPRRRGLTGTA